MVVTIILVVALLSIIIVLAVQLKKSERMTILLIGRITTLEVKRQEDFVRICELTNDLNDAHSNLELVIGSTDKQLEDAHTNIELLLRGNHSKE